MSVIVSVQSKVCSKCGEVKLLEEFYRNKKSYVNKCKCCANAYVAKYQKDHPEKIRNISNKSYRNKVRLQTNRGVNDILGCVYVLRDPGNKALKIGFTTNLKERLGKHITSNPFLVLINVINNVSLQVEQDIHKSMHKYRLPNTYEWYQDDSHVLSLFIDYKINQSLRMT